VASLLHPSASTAPAACAGRGLARCLGRRTSRGRPVSSAAAGTPPSSTLTPDQVEQAVSTSSLAACTPGRSEMVEQRLLHRRTGKAGVLVQVRVVNKPLEGHQATSEISPASHRTNATTNPTQKSSPHACRPDGSTSRLATQRAGRRGDRGHPRRGGRSPRSPWWRRPVPGPWGSPARSTPSR
jgi:hypothetical protein